MAIKQDRYAELVKTQPEQQQDTKAKSRRREVERGQIREENERAERGEKWREGRAEKGT